MVANILIAIGFFFAGAAFSTLARVNELRKARRVMRNKHFIVYEF